MDPVKVASKLVSTRKLSELHPADYTGYLQTLHESKIALPVSVQAKVAVAESIRKLDAANAFSAVASAKEIGK